MMFTPLFDTSKELYEYLNGVKLGVYNATMYQTRKLRRWRVKYAPDDDAVVSIEAGVVTAQVGNPLCPFYVKSASPIFVFGSVTWGKSTPKGKAVYGRTTQPWAERLP